MASKTRKAVIPQAVSAAEAAAIMGIHWVMPKRMAEKGLISNRVVTESVNTDEPERFYAIYDSEECDENYREYERKIEARGGKNDRRPRSWLHLRPTVLAHLAKVKTPIAFDDAITLGEAAAILCVHHTLVPRLLRSGKVVGRIAWNQRGKTGSRSWIVSRRSCLENVKEVRAAEAAGTKRGRTRAKLRPK